MALGYVQHHACRAHACRAEELGSIWEISNSAYEHGSKDGMVVERDVGRA